jgi:hypothetical protein
MLLAPGNEERLLRAYHTTKPRACHNVFMTAE